MLDYLAPLPLDLQPIEAPFVGDWDIDQVFQMEMRCGQQPEAPPQFAFGYYDNVQNNFILELRGNGEDKFYTANGGATLRSLLDLAYGANAAYEFTNKSVVQGDPLPQDDNELLELALEDLEISSMDVTIWGGNFGYEAPAAEQPAVEQQEQQQEQQEQQEQQQEQQIDIVAPQWAPNHVPPAPIAIPPLQLPAALPVLPIADVDAQLENLVNNIINNLIYDDPVEAEAAVAAAEADAVAALPPLPLPQDNNDDNDDAYTIYSEDEQEPQEQQEPWP